MKANKSDEKMTYKINDVIVSKRAWVKSMAFHKKYDSYPRIEKTCLGCLKSYWTIEELKGNCPFCDAPFHYDPKTVLEKIK